MTSSRARKIDSSYQIRENFNAARQFYLLNRKKIECADLAKHLPKLETDLDEKSPLDQFNSFFLFITLCFKYQEKLPENFSQFRDGTLLDAFQKLKKNHLFKLQTTSGDKQFIKRAIQTLSLSVPIDEGHVVAKENHLNNLRQVHEDRFVEILKQPCLQEEKMNQPVASRVLDKVALDEPFLTATNPKRFCLPTSPRKVPGLMMFNHLSTGNTDQPIDLQQQKNRKRKYPSPASSSTSVY